jgi:hypothetical protein
VRFEVIMAMTTGNTVLRGVMSCSLIEVYLASGAKYCKENSVPIGSLTAPTLPRTMPRFKLSTSLGLYGLLFDSKDGKNAYLPNVGYLPPDYTASQPIR